MNLYTIMGMASSIAFLIPIILILVLKLSTYRSFIALLIYYISVFIYNLLTEGYIQLSDDVTHYWGIANNMMDAPLMLAFLVYLSPSEKLTKQIKISIYTFILFELVVMIAMKFSLKGLTIIIAPGLLLVIYFCLQFFARYARMVVEHNKSIGKAFISGSILFAYGCFVLLYAMYYVAKTNQIEDTFLVYFMGTVISSLFISTGLIFEWKRIKQVKELKITRKELSDIYKDANMAAPNRTAIVDLDFDREAWN